VNLLLIRDQLALLSRLEMLWIQAEGLAKSQYEAGRGSQSDLMRAQLERNRLKQRRWVLEAENRRQLAVLNRLRGFAPGATVSTIVSLVELADPPLGPRDELLRDAETRSPELAQARIAAMQAQQRIALARKEKVPDVTLSAAVMPRGGDFPAMWQLGVSMPIPVWTRSKQGHAVLENEARFDADTSNVETLRQILRQRVEERVEVLGALLESNRLYRSGLLVQSEATVASTLAQYGVGRVNFALVLEALAGYLGDAGGFLESIARAQEVSIALTEVSLDPVVGGGTAMGGSSIQGTGSAGGRSASGGASGSQNEDQGGSSGMKRM
jgi:outer membrane protein TolC